jgi:opacity protein-like surface antigen
MGFLNRKHIHILTGFLNFNFLCFIVLFISSGILVLGNDLQIRIQKVSSSPKIDGFIEESFWGEITPLKDFVQFDPYNGKPPSEETFIYLAYDEDNLYVAFNCLDSQPGKIKGDLTPREKYGVNTNDDVRVILDTYYDKRNEYDFHVNSKGVQFDLPGDYVWESGAKVNEDGWSAELKIPFKSIRFPTGSSKPWGVNFARYIFRLKEKSYLTHVGRDDVKLEKSALLYGLRGIKGGKSVEFFPYSGYRNSVSGDEKDSKFAVGLDAKYSITSNLNLDLTASPDFSEVESDPFFYQLTPYEVHIGEKRPFFQEAEKYFVEELFYTKRITNPKFAFKLTGKERGYTIGLLGALNKAEDTNEYLGAFNMKKDIFSLSSVSFVYSGYKTPGFTNQNAGMNLNLRFSKKTEMYFHSYFTFNSDMEKRENGHYFLRFTHYPDEGLNFWVALRRIEKKYRPRAGYWGWETDFQFWTIMPGYAKRINKYGIKKISFDMDIVPFYDISGKSLGYTFVPFRIWINSLKEHYFHLSYRIGKQKVQT